MSDSLPRAVALDPQYFFASDAVFKRGAAPALADLAGLIFTLGKAVVTILPEGTVANDVKIRGIRQAVALNSYLVSKGLSQARIDVNLTRTDIKFPREITNVSGLIVLIDYEKEPRLTELEGARYEGPKVSLGVYPTELSVEDEEGSIVEFSALKPPSGDVSWKFEIFELRQGDTLHSLQKAEGSGPLCRQTYWNGRKGFFGDPYPSGKYMFSITATDEHGRESNLRRFLMVKSVPGAAGKPAESGKTIAKSRRAASSNARSIPIKSRRANKPAGMKSRSAAALARARTASVPAAAKTEKPPAQNTVETAAPPAVPSQESKTRSTGVTFRIKFDEGTDRAVRDSEKQLAKVAENMNYYPMAQIKLIGYANPAEPGPNELARRRVDFVISRLKNRYNVAGNRMESSIAVSDERDGMVEIKMQGNN